MWRWNHRPKSSSFSIHLPRLVPWDTAQINSCGRQPSESDPPNICRSCPVCQRVLTVVGVCKSVGTSRTSKATSASTSCTMLVRKPGSTSTAPPTARLHIRVAQLMACMSGVKCKAFKMHWPVFRAFWSSFCISSDLSHPTLLPTFPNGETKALLRR